MRIVTTYFIGKNKPQLAATCIKKLNLFIMIVGACLSLILFLLRHVLANLFFKDVIPSNHIFVNCVIVGVFLVPLFLSIDTVMSFFW